MVYKILTYVFGSVAIFGFVLNMIFIYLLIKFFKAKQEDDEKKGEDDFDYVDLAIRYKKLVSFMKYKKYDIEKILKGE